MPIPKGSNTGPVLSEEERAARLAKVAERFGPRAVPFWLNTPGDYAIGTVEEVSEFLHDEFGAVPQIVFTLEEGTSAESEKSAPLAPGSRYVLRLFYKAAQGRAPKVGDRFGIANYGTVRNRADTYNYNDVELRVMTD